jgi:hypothetical protein
MHYVTHRYHRIQKRKFGVRCPNMFFCGIRTGPARATKIMRRHFTHLTHRNPLRDPHILSDEKHMFSVTRPGTHLVESIPVPHEHEK